MQKAANKEHLIVRDTSIENVEGKKNNKIYTDPSKGYQTDQ